MRTYEALYIIRPDLDEDGVQTVASGVETLITGDGGAIVRSEIWGKRRLAFEVNGRSEGIYVLLRYDCPVETLPKLNQHFRLSDDIVRQLVVHLDVRTLKLEAEQLKRTELLAEQRRAAETSRGGDSDDGGRGHGSRDRDRDRDRARDSVEA